MVETAAAISAQPIIETVPRVVESSEPQPVEATIKMPVYEEVFASVSVTSQFQDAGRDVMAQDSLVLAEFRRRRDIFIGSQTKTHLEELSSR